MARYQVHVPATELYNPITGEIMVVSGPPMFVPQPQQVPQYKSSYGEPYLRTNFQTGYIEHVQPVVHEQIPQYQPHQHRRNHGHNGHLGNNGYHGHHTHHGGSSSGSSTRQNSHHGNHGHHGQHGQHGNHASSGRRTVNGVPQLSPAELMNQLTGLRDAGHRNNCGF